MKTAAEIAGCREVERLDKVASLRVLLDNMQHGHKFDRHSLRCECGMMEREYKLMLPQWKFPCPIAVQREKEKLERSQLAFDKAVERSTRTVAGRTFNE